MRPEGKLKIFVKGVGPEAVFTEYGQFLSIRSGDVRTPLIPMEAPWPSTAISRRSATPPPDGSAVRVSQPRSVLDADGTLVRHDSWRRCLDRREQLPPAPGSCRKADAHDPGPRVSQEQVTGALKFRLGTQSAAGQWRASPRTRQIIGRLSHAVPAPQPEMPMHACRSTHNRRRRQSPTPTASSASCPAPVRPVRRRLRGAARSPPPAPPVRRPPPARPERLRRRRPARPRLRCCRAAAAAIPSSRRGASAASAARFVVSMVPRRTSRPSLGQRHPTPLRGRSRRSSSAQRRRRR
jgi:hypothetical protein